MQVLRNQQMIFKNELALLYFAKRNEMMNKPVELKVVSVCRLKEE